MGVGEPAADWDGVLGVENVRSWRVVDDDCVLQIAADLGEVLEYVSTSTCFGHPVRYTLT
jgi:hypothetical protein